MAYKSRLELEIDSTTGERRLKSFEKRLELTERAGNKTSGSIGSLTTTMRAMGGAALGLSASAGVFTAIARSAAQSAAEIDNLARLSNTSAEEFQRAAFASRAYGVEQDKLADILKDTNDRVGDFLSTGGGEMKDFFEQIAPQIGVTAEEFRNLSGPQALQKYYDGLQAANLSQAEMTFYMESVADEATALIPLLRDGGAEMERLGQEADDLSAVLSMMEIQRLKDIRGEFGQLEQQLGTETMRAVSQFDDLMKSSLEGISYGINNVARGFNAFMDSFRDNEVKRSVAGIDAELNTLFDTKARLEQRIDMFGADAPQSQDSIAALGELREEYTALIDRKKELQQAGLPVTEPEIVQLSRAVISTADLAKAQKDAQAEADRFSDSLLSIQDRLFPVEAAQRSYREEQAAINRGLSEGIITADRYTEAMMRLERAQLSTQTAAGAYGGGGGFGSEIGSRGGVGAPTDPLAITVGSQEQDYWGEWLSSAETAFTDFDQMAANTAESFQRGFGNAFESMIFDSENLGDAAQGMFEGIARTMVNALGQMAGQWLAYQAVQMAIGKTTEATAIGSAIATGSSIAAAYAPAAAAASLASFGANSVPAMAGMSSAYGLSSTLALTGMAHDGIDRVPREGTWLLDKGERVMNRPQADRLDSYIDRQERGGQTSESNPITVDVQVINNGKPQQASAAVEQRSQRDFVVRVMLDDLKSGKSNGFTEQLASTFSMSRRGR